MFGTLGVGAPDGEFVPVMHLHAPPQIQCPSCRRLVPFDPYVEVVGEVCVLECPWCAGVRIDLALEQVLARN